jgi:hypothetical protein
MTLWPPKSKIRSVVNSGRRPEAVARSVADEDNLFGTHSLDKPEDSIVPRRDNTKAGEFVALYVILVVFGIPLLALFVGWSWRIFQWAAGL